MDQVLMNLTVNARDAIPEGGLIVIETRNVFLDEAYTRMNVEAKPGSYVLLTVTDNGLGMDSDIQDHIFEPFFTTKELGAGTGLGLATVHGIVLKHAGHITCSSAKGQGTSFNIYIPAVLPDLDHSEIIISQSQSGGSETILLVDDDDPIRELGTRMLIMGGYHVITAKNGKDALEAYRVKQQDISLVILDLMMPEMGGKRCLEELLKLDPSIRVLMASGYLDQNSDQVSLSQGAKGFIPKPFELSHLLDTVRSTLDEK
jgi:CheY-like chemotaxis protein